MTGQGSVEHAAAAPEHKSWALRYFQWVKGSKTDSRRDATQRILLEWKKRISRRDAETRRGAEKKGETERREMKARETEDEGGEDAGALNAGALTCSPRLKAKKENPLRLSASAGFMIFGFLCGLVPT